MNDGQDPSWSCHGCGTAHPASVTKFWFFPESGAYPRKYCQKTYPLPLYLFSDGMRVRLTRPVTVPWLSEDPIPQGALATIVKFNAFCVQFDGFTSVVPRYEGRYDPLAVLNTVGKRYLPDWLEPVGQENGEDN